MPPVGEVYLIKERFVIALMSHSLPFKSYTMFD